MSDSVRPHSWQPTRLRSPWDFPSKDTGVGCHFLLQCRKVKSESEVAQSCPTLRDPMDCSLSGSSDHGIFQARVLEWVAIAFSSSSLEKWKWSHSVVSTSATPWTTAHQASLSITNCWSLPKPMSIELVMPSNHLILCCSLLLPSIFPSIRVFSNESVVHSRWPKYWSHHFLANRWRNNRNSARLYFGGLQNHCRWWLQS